MIPFEIGKQLVWDVTVVDAFAPICLNQGSLCNPGTTANETEARKLNIREASRVNRQWLLFSTWGLILGNIQQSIKKQRRAISLLLASCYRVESSDPSLPRPPCFCCRNEKHRVSFLLLGVVNGRLVVHTR